LTTIKFLFKIYEKSQENKTVAIRKKNQEQVLSMFTNGVVRAYLLRILSWHKPVITISVRRRYWSGGDRLPLGE